MATIIRIAVVGNTKDQAQNRWIKIIDRAISALFRQPNDMRDVYFDADHRIDNVDVSLNTTNGPVILQFSRVRCHGISMKNIPSDINYVIIITTLMNVVRNSPEIHQISNKTIDTFALNWVDTLTRNNPAINIIIYNYAGYHVSPHDTAQSIARMEHQAYMDEWHKAAPTANILAIASLHGITYSGQLFNLILNNYFGFDVSIYNKSG